ncbi:glycosyltransferase family 2 protein [Dyadobacter sp. CY356]|uniref:glycosyltransferase family 2 protein n=1 Tax=Dyadobacter sp. CY356 TaxID=2906442 RepID=UPI001F1EED97|nr:glycosyltransferase [Dyadobacter sp. CY356]MCF0055039.1 glycosyltransferase [Dyadobacter sp. CY356]
MNNPVHISVVIPTFRRVTLLMRVLDAMHSQTYPHQNFEVIVVSDGPDPATEKMISEMIPDFSTTLRLHYYSLPAKSGPAAARNAGWLRSKGELIVFTDDDCIPASNWLAAYQQAYGRHTQGKPVSFTGKVNVPVKQLPTDYEKNISHLSTAEFITANCACTRSALCLVGGFDEAFAAAWREDSDLHFKLLRAGIAINHVSDALVFHPVRKASWGVSIYEQRKSMFNALLFKKHPDLYRKRIADTPVWRYYLIILLTFVSVFSLFLGDKIAFVIAFFSWLSAVGSFVIRRLDGTDKSLKHRLEMVVTSLAIPYLSVYWTLRGAWKYKVFFL